MGGFSWNWQYAIACIPQLIEGLQLTIALTFLGSILAFVLGLVWMLLRLANVPILSPLAALFVEFVRGTPFLVQVYFLFYVTPGLGITFSAFMTGVIALALFNSAFIAEVYRAGIEGIHKGQWEASLTLGLPVRRVWTHIILPQALRIIIPMLGNYVTVMFKETAVLSTITVMELLAQAMDAGFLRFRFVEPLTMAAGFYFIISYASARGVRLLEARNAARA